MAGSMRRGARQDLPPAPLPQGEVGKPVVNTQIVNGFWQFLPAKSTVFLNKILFRNYPRPLFIGKLPPYPVPLPIAKLVVPENQAFIIKDFSFKVYQQSGIGTDDTVEVPSTRVASYFAFEVKVGNRSPYDMFTNITARGQVIDYAPVQGAGGRSVPPTVGQGTAFPFSGVNNPLGDNFANYAMSGDLIELTAYVLREPEFDARMLSAQFAGYNVDQRILQTILSRITA